MRINYIYTFFAGFLLFISCAKPVSQNTSYQRTGMVNYLTYTKSELTVTSEHAAENVGKAISYAEINALENILFRGIPGSPSEAPLISDEIEAVKNHKQILNTFIFETGCKEYVTKSETISRERQGTLTFVKQKVTFDLNGIRKFLEKNNIVKRFGL
ncbi:hypothetical protein GVN16_04550 [Emticicia sp. CRIBPO]|uniref:hypothetical protein n=1 Tax=Emticicia sp. CRIBPO TaxID=2683258 RepID=UPI0014134FA1|nr:hypothetical protein [Emticicia sp. CRIBPO]NBA85015.1 hypothetical protein [Emticicia sp. CRIBPO]